MIRMKHLCWVVVLMLAVSLPAARAENPDVLLFQAQMKLAKRGDPGAQYYLGEMYEQGLGTEPDLAEAFKWYETSAKKGNRLAKRKLSMRKQIMSQHEKEKAEEQRAAEAEAAQAAARARTAAIARARAQQLTNDKTEQEARREEEKARAEVQKARAAAAAKLRAERQARVRKILEMQASRPEAFE